MSDGTRSRRRFLADILFLGGALGAGAFLMQASDGETPGAQPTPESTPTPASTSCPPAVKGDYAPPVVQDPLLQPAGEPMPPQPPVVGGKPVAAPPPQLDGAVVSPQPPQPAPPSVKGKVAAPSPPERP